MMDVQALLETISHTLAIATDMANGMHQWRHDETIERTLKREIPKTQSALTDLRQHIEAQATLLAQTQAVASQQQATLEKVQRANGDLTKTLTLAYITMRINLADEVGECPIDTTGIARVLSAFNPNYKADYDEWFYRDVTP